MYVGDVKIVKDRSNTPKGCNAMYVGDVKDVKDRPNTRKGCNAMYVEDIKDRSNTPKGCNDMSHFAYACKMQYPLNLVLEKSEYLWFYLTFCIVILDCGLKLHKLSNHTLVMLQK